MFSIKLCAQPQIRFADSKQNFGFVKRGNEVSLHYLFTNAGDQPLLISYASATCSCTEVSWPKEPIMPGKSGTIEVVFKTDAAHDRQDRKIEVECNDPKSPVKIRFKGVVTE